jgi:hypothetical protein
MSELLSTREVSWVLDQSAWAVRRMIREQEIEGVRIAAGFRVPRKEVLRLARKRVETEAGRKVSERQLEGLIDEVIATNRERTSG